MHVNLTFYYSIANYKKPHILVFNPIRVNLTIKRFYPGNPGSNGTKLPSSTANPKNINKTETPYTSTSKSTEEVNPFIPQIPEIPSLDYIAPTSFIDTTSSKTSSTAIPQAAASNHSILGLKTEQNAQTTLDAAKAHLELQQPSINIEKEKVNELHTECNKFYTPISNEMKELKDNFGKTKAQSSEKKEEIFNAINGGSVLNKNIQSGLLTGVNINIETFPLKTIDDDDLLSLPPVDTPYSSPILHPITSVFSTQTHLEFPQKKEGILNLIQLLERYKLWTFDNGTGEKLTKAFFDLGFEINCETIKLTLSKESLEMPKFDLGLLSIIQQEKTILLLSEHKHVVLLYTNLDSEKIIWGYLTSNKSEKNLILSDQQPFQDQQTDVNTSIIKKQRVHLLETPFIAKNSYVEVLPHGSKQIGEDYLKTVLHKVNDMFKKFVVPKLINKDVNVYDGKGFTEEMIKKMVKIHEQKEEQLGQKWFNEYITTKNKEKFLVKIEKGKVDHIFAYETLQKLINDNKKK